jgi:hypothetical protein
MNKVKVRCAVCGKSFKTPSLKKTVCPSCEAEQKRARHQQPAAVTKPAVQTSSTLDVRAALRAAQENQGQFGAYRPPAPPPAPKPQGQRAEAKPKAPKPPREKKPRVQTKPFEPTPEQIAAIKDRYIQLAQPEFNGIRHQIANEMGIPLRVVKQAVKEVREEQEIPSWWDRGGAMPGPEDLEKIRAMYVPLLPEPEIGVHKRIAAALKLTNTSVYQAIGQIRTEMNLPRYNPREQEGAEGETAPAPGTGGHEVGLAPAAGE